MPFKSEAQRKWMFAAQARGELPKGTAERWQRETKNKNLPEHVKKKKKRITKKGFYYLGFHDGFLEKISSGYSGAFIPNQKIVDKINNFLDTHTVEGIIRKIKNDPKLTEEQKEKLISEILGWKDKFKNLRTGDSGLAGSATGLASGALLTWLLLRNVDKRTIPPWLQALLGSAIILSGGIIGNLTQKRMSEKIYSTQIGKPSFSRWRGL